MRDTVSVFSYEAWQGRQGASLRGWISTVLFEDKPAGPNGLFWLHVQATRLTELAPS